MTSRPSPSRRLRPARPIRLVLMAAGFVLVLAACTSGSDEVVEPGGTTGTPPSTEATIAEPTTTTEAAPRPPAPTIPRPPVTPGEPLAPDACTKSRLQAAYNAQSGPEDQLDADRIQQRRCRDPFAALSVEPARFEEGADPPEPDLLLFVKDAGGWRFLGGVSVPDEQRCVELGAPASLCRV